MRNDESFEQLWEQSSDFCEKHKTSGFSTQVDPSIQPRKRKVPQKLIGSVMNSFIGVADYEGDTLKTDLRVDFYFTILDDIMSNICKGFDGRSAVMKGVASLHLGSENHSSENEQALKEFAEFYGLNGEDCLIQYQLLKGNSIINEAKPKQLKEVWRLLVNSKLKNVYTAIAEAVKIAVTLPVMSAAAERVYSKLKLIKTFSRSTSADVRSADLIQIYFEQDTKLVLDELVTQFAAKPRKLSL